VLRAGGWHGWVPAWLGDGAAGQAFRAAKIVRSRNLCFISAPACSMSGRQCPRTRYHAPPGHPHQGPARRVGRVCGKTAAQVHWGVSPWQGKQSSFACRGHCGWHNWSHIAVTIQEKGAGAGRRRQREFTSKSGRCLA
jgi:hypothetical protein